MNALTLVDAHVHVHPRTDVDSLLHHAAANFASAAGSLQAGRWQGVLMLAEMTGVDWFGGLLKSGRVGSSGDWQLRPDTGETVSTHVVAGSQQLLVVAGRQVVTAEGIEVLALCTRFELADGLSLTETLAVAHTAGAIVVLPWGAGKWLGRRGRLVSATLARAGALGVFAGDNGGRPALWPAPLAFRMAVAAGKPLLSGTDPLPVPQQEQRVGRMGVWLPGALPERAPAAALKSLLLESPAAVCGYGRNDSARSFIVNQARLRLRRHE